MAGYAAHGGTSLRWEDLLAYEFAIRKSATDLVNDGLSSFTEGLISAWKDGDLRSTHFTLPLTVSGKRGSSTARSSNEEPAVKQLKQEIRSLKTMVSKMGAGKGKGGGKGRKTSTALAAEAPQDAASSSNTGKDLSNLKATQHLNFRTEGPNGKQICHFFQRGACTRPNCKFAHACWRCLKSTHGILDCPAPQRLK